MSDIKNPYHIMGIDKKADVNEIKKRYRHLVNKFHPDKIGGDQYIEEYNNVVKAYKILSDIKKRKQYDDTGSCENNINGDRQRAISEIMSIFFQLIKSDKKFDYINQIDISIEKGMQEFRDKIQSNKMELVKLKGIRKKIKCKKGVDNIFQMAIDAQARDIKEHNDRLDHKIKQGDLMIKILKDFNYDFDKHSCSNEMTISAFNIPFHMGIGTG